VPDINDFLKGFTNLLKPHGVATFEFPHLLRMLAENQFDTIYHEHFSYLSLTAVEKIFSSNGLAVFDVEEIPTHGGSLRVFAQRAASGVRPVADRVGALLAREREAGLATAEGYRGFQARAEKVKDDFVSFLIGAKRDGKRVAAYGAAAKGNTLMNYAGLKHDLISFVCDAAPSKQTKFMPGNHIPIHPPEELAKRKPDWVVILPWNIAPEVVQQQSQVKSWGGRFVVAVPEVKVLS
jgi:hypothetical protein